MTAQKTIKMLSLDNKTLTTDLDRAGYRKMGVYVKPAANYDEARKILAAEKVDLIVVNMDYAAINATQIAKHLKAQPDYAQIPIVLTSVQTTAKVRNSALEAGADLFVEQPLPRQYFIEKLKQLLEHKTRTNDRVSINTEVTFTIGDKSDKCPIGDLSSSGILLSTNVELEDGMVVSLEFEIDGFKKPIKVEGEVVRTIRYSDKFPDRMSGVGIRFTTFQGDSQKRLEKYIETHAHADQKMHYYL